MAKHQGRLTRRGTIASGLTGTGAIAGCLGTEESGDGTTTTQPAASPAEPPAALSEQREGVIHVTSAAEMNQAFEQLPDYGGIIRWLPGRYTGQAFTEMVEIPTDGREFTLDMRHVHVKIRTQDPYRGEDGAFFYKPSGVGAADDGGDVGSNRVDIFGPGKFTVGGPLDNDDVDIMELYETEDGVIDTHLTGSHVRNVLYLRQSVNNGHRLRVYLRAWGGDNCLKVGSEDDPTGKDRCFFYGQLAGWDDAAFHLEGASINNRIYAQAERPSGDASDDNAGYRIRNGQNTLMLIHIDAEHPLDIQAPGVKVDSPGGVGNPEPFKNGRLGVRPLNVVLPNYTATVHQFDTDWRPLYDVGASGQANQTLNGTGDLVLSGGGSGDRAYIQTPSQISQIFHHAHVHASGKFADMNGARFRFGPYVDEDNYAMLVLDDRDGGNDREGWSVEVAAGGEVVAQQAAEEPGLNYGFDELRRGLTVFANEGYQSFFLHYALAGETRADLSAWGEPVRLRADIETVGGGDPAFELRGLEHGYAKKGEGAFDGAFD